MKELDKNEIDVLDRIRICTGFQYFSGYEDPDECHNHPAIFVFRDEEGQKLGVTGPTMYKEFPINEYSKAIEAYKSLLAKNGYEVSS